MRFAPSVLFALALVLLPACGGGGTEPAAEGGGITLSSPSSEVVEGFTLAVTAASSDPKNATLLWSTDDMDIATVDQQGTVLGCAPGTVVVLVLSPETDAQATIEINVVADAGFNKQLPTDDVNLAPTLDRTSTVGRCEVTIHHTGIAADVVRGRCRQYHRLRIPYAGVLGDVGKPELPFHRMYFVIPVDPVTQARAIWSVEVERTSPISYAGIRPWPHQPPIWLDGLSEEPEEPVPFVVKEAAYQAQEPRIAQPYGAEASEIGNLPMLEVWVAPCRYTPASETLELFQTTRVIVTFEGTGQLAMPRPLGDYKGIQERGVDELLDDRVQNWDLVAPITLTDLVAPPPPIDDFGIHDLPFDLLIITRPSLEPQARRLARWRQDHGTRVWLASLDETTYPDRDAILALIRSLDELNRVEVTGGPSVYAMRALLLFGDAEHIPPFLGENQRNVADPTEENPAPVPVAGTDLPYSTLRGSDVHVSVAMGRISVNDDDPGVTEDGKAVVDKIMAYETRMPGRSPFRGALYGYFEDWVDPRGVALGVFDFTGGSRRVRVHPPHHPLHRLVGKMIRPLSDVPLDEGSWGHRVASYDAARGELVLGQDWSGDPGVTTTHLGVQVARDDGREDLMCLLGVERIRSFWQSLGIPYELDCTRKERPAEVPIPVWDHRRHLLHPTVTTCGWDASEAQIASTWREGRDGIVVHLGHGKPDHWQHPRLRASAGLSIPSPGGWYPIVLSLNCSAGYFDAETDWVRVWDAEAEESELVENTRALDAVRHHGESFCEDVLRYPDGGGVAALGASRGATSDYVDQLLDGLFGAMYEDFPRGTVLPGFRPRRPLTRMGDIVRAGKNDMYRWVRAPYGAGKPPSAKFCLEIFHLFGDPMLRVRVPQQAIDD